MINAQNSVKSYWRYQTTYKHIGTPNPTKNMKEKMQRKLRAIKKARHLDQAIYNKIYPTCTSDATPRFYAKSDTKYH